MSHDYRRPRHRLLDGIHEKMHGVPMSWGIVVVGAVIVVGLVLEGRSRR